VSLPGERASLPGGGLTARDLYLAQEPLRQFTNPSRPPLLDGLFRDQLSSDAQRCGSRQNQIAGRQLIHASCGHERHLRQSRLERSDVTFAAELRTRKDFDKVSRGLPRLAHLRGG
jgi:hypothetical protein